LQRIYQPAAPGQGIEGVPAHRAATGRVQNSDIPSAGGCAGFYNDSQTLFLEANPISILVGSSSVDTRLQGSFEITGAKKVPVPKRVVYLPCGCFINYFTLLQDGIDNKLFSEECDICHLKTH
jgi:hypothetical protein